MLIDSPVNGTGPDPVTAMETAINGTKLPKSKNAAVFFPWVSIADPLNGGNLRLTSPVGTIAGLYARTDGNRGVWKAPAGTDATLVGVQAVGYPLTDRENGVLNPHGANCLRIFPVLAPSAGGARTVAGRRPDGRRVEIRARSPDGASSSRRACTEAPSGWCLNRTTSRSGRKSA